MRKHGLRARWAVPAGVVAAVGIVIAASAVASAEAVPSLPAKTAAQLLAAVGTNGGKPLGPLTATVQQTADFGLPQLPVVALQSNGASSTLLAGTQSVSFWYRDSQHIRVAEPVRAGETDYRLNGRTLWVWDSKTQTATKVNLPAGSSGWFGGAAVGKGGAPRVPAGQHAKASGTLPDSPLAAANQILKAVGPTTVVSVQRNLYVAGRAAYQLALVPKSGQSLVGKVLIAIDAAKDIPLRVQVFARGSSGLAYGIGFTSLSFGAPAASNFSFTPPPGATVKTQTVPSNPKALLPGGLNLGGLGAAPGPAGSVKLERPLTSHPLSASMLKQVNAKFAKSLPATFSAKQRAQAISKFDQMLKSGRAAGPKSINGWSGSPPLSPLAGKAGAPRVIGTSWLSVIATPASPQVAAAVKQLLSGPGGPHGRPGVMSPQSSSSQVTSSQVGGSAAYGSTLSVSFPGAVPGQDAALLHALLAASTPVHGSWGSGRLLQTKLLSVLVTSDGRILAGAVTPAQLYRDVVLDAR
jgi:hypothetical protein